MCKPLTFQQSFETDLKPNYFFLEPQLLSNSYLESPDLVGSDHNRREIFFEMEVEFTTLGSVPYLSPILPWFRGTYSGKLVNVFPFSSAFKYFLVINHYSF